MRESICAIDGCDKPARARGWCSAHYERWRKHGDPLTIEKVGRKAGYASETHGMWTGDQVGYHGAHRRVYGAKGPASDHLCKGCGGQARQWAYDHADPDERPSRRGPYSLNPERYHPLCARCHKVRDVAKLIAEGWTAWNRGPEVCAVADCGMKVHARGWCGTHYGRWWKGKKS